jgi:YidC/Oxa1 family membrane protein insertase
MIETLLNALTQAFLLLNTALGGNLGLTIIVVAVVSRLIYHPLLVVTLKQSKAMRDMKPRLDEIKKKHSGNNPKILEEQSKLFREYGVSPVAGLVGCLGIITQLVIFIILINVLSRVIASGVETQFLFWDLAQPNVIFIPGIPFALPGLLLILMSIATLIQTVMTLPESTKRDRGKSDKAPDLAEAFTASTSQTAFLIPLIFLVIGRNFSAGLVLYWLFGSIAGIIQQYYIVGWGGLRPWIKRIFP